MHIEILVEDLSGKATLDILMPKLIGDKHTFRIHSYKGIGRIPGNMRDATDPSNRILLENLPKLLKGYGRTFGPHYPAVVILVCDLDDKNHKQFLKSLQEVLACCDPRPNTRFCIAVEEGEAWFLGDLHAVKAAYPHAKSPVLNSYENDSICGTWEKLADAVFPGGSIALGKLGRQSVGAEKSRWAEKISPQMDVDNNQSPSFNVFREVVRSL